MTPEQLKASILQYAIQGKLVEQRPEEGTGEELYRQIQAEKQRLIKEGKIKKEKALPEIAEDEIPFDIPDTWRWVRVAQIVTLNPKNDLADDLETSFIPMPCVMDGFRNLHTYEVKKWKEIKKGFTHFAEGDIGVAKITPCFQNRKSVIFRNLKNGYGSGTTELTVVRTINETVLSEYLLWFFKTEYFIANGVKSFTGTAGQQRIHKDYLATCLIPLPSLTEQKRIVAKIEELLPYVDRYAAAYEKLEQFNAKFPEDMKKSILQYAIQGKLVEQRLEEGTGEELYRQIQTEKQRLIKEGKIKKEKPLAEIVEDEIPFDIPESWKWVKVGSLAVVQSSKRVFEKDYVSDGIPFFRSKEIGDLYRNEPIKTELFITAEHYKSLAEEYGVPQTGDILITSVGTIGNTWICDGRKFYYKDGNITQICGNQFFDSKYVEYFLHSPLFEKQALSTVAGTAYSALTIIKLKNLLMPLPPLAEQKRIVAKLEEILPLCERLK